MRPFTALAVAVLSFSSFVVAIPLDNQVVLPDDKLLDEKKRWNYSVCGDSNDIIQIQSIEVTPDPPQAGKDLTVNVKAITTERIEEGAYAMVTVKLGRIKILTKEFDLCEEACVPFIYDPSSIQGSRRHVAATRTPLFSALLNLDHTKCNTPLPFQRKSPVPNSTYTSMDTLLTTKICSA